MRNLVRYHRQGSSSPRLRAHPCAQSLDERRPVRKTRREQSAGRRRPLRRPGPGVASPAAWKRLSAGEWNRCEMRTKECPPVVQPIEPKVSEGAGVIGDLTAVAPPIPDSGDGGIGSSRHEGRWSFSQVVQRSSETRRCGRYLQCWPVASRTRTWQFKSRPTSPSQFLSSRPQVDNGRAKGSATTLLSWLDDASDRATRC